MISKSAQNKEAFTQQLYFTSAARKAWMHLLGEVNKVYGTIKVLLPAYIGYTEREGSGVFDPIEATNTPFCFYEVNEQLGFSLQEIETVLSGGDIKLMLVIHYFGFSNTNIDELAALCKKYNVLLVEDCAHAFQLNMPSQRLGNKGDFSFYSLHKYLSSENGGILKVNCDGFPMLPVPVEYKAPIEVLEQYIKTDLAAIAEKRRSNFKLYTSLLKNVSEIDLMFTLSNGDIPHNFPIKIKQGAREELYFYLMQKGIPTIALYYRLIDQIKKEDYPLSFKIADEILNLPVHQDTTTDDIDHICTAIKTFYFNRNNKFILA